MKKFSRWAAQFLLAAGSMFALLVLVDMGKGTMFADAWQSALAWAVVSSAIFVGTRYFQAERGKRCAVCETFEPK
ncbi:hypothetical protein GCM10027321_02710 [Massilia terrae]|uniref:Holin n=1 Tax=Massilia terrae TaxID=1811224 RepID=A0ABT2CVX0_9BURK|nr:hypothetical protein [Massilia terrae]MCS0657365.1 hypothetical protein [Massilia terrae]